MPRALEVDSDVGDRSPYLRARERAPGAVAEDVRRPDPSDGAQSTGEPDFVTTLCDPALAGIDPQLGDLLPAVLELDLEDAGDLGGEGERDGLARRDVL